MSQSSPYTKNIKIGVLRGGPSHQYDISLKSGAHVLNNLPSGLNPLDIFISRDGIWHVQGVSREPEKILRNVDVVWNALHGSFGEDGKIQKILKTLGINHTGSDTFGSALAINKNLSRKVLSKHNFKIPFSTVMLPHENTYPNLNELFRSFPQPSIIKPLTGGSSIGVTIAYNFDDFKKGIERALLFSGGALIEEYIHGVEVVCSVIDNQDGTTSYALQPLSIKKSEKNSHYSFEMKLSDELDYLSDEDLLHEEKKMIQEQAILAHRALGLRHYSSADFIIHPKRGIFILEVNSLPQFTTNSPLSISLKKSGIEFSDFIDHVVALSLKK